MKMALYIILLFAEMVVDLLTISLAWTNFVWFSCKVNQNLNLLKKKAS